MRKVAPNRVSISRFVERFPEYRADIIELRFHDAADESRLLCPDNMIVVFRILVYAAIYIHDIPYEMAKKRNHPHQDAIHVRGWLSLFTLHAIWPFLWIWTTLYKPGVGYGFKPDSVASLEHQLADDLQND